MRIAVVSDCVFESPQEGGHGKEWLTLLDNTPNLPSLQSVIDATDMSRYVYPALDISSRIKAGERTWHWHIFQKEKVLTFGWADTSKEASRCVAQWFSDNEDKLYLIEHGVLRRRALRQSRKRNYARTAECWKRHEKKEHALQAVNLERSVASIYQHERYQIAYLAMSLADRTRYEKLLSAPRPLTKDEYDFVMQFIFEWALKAVTS